MDLTIYLLTTNAPPLLNPHSVCLNQTLNPALPIISVKIIPSKKKQKHFPGSPAIPSLLSPPQTKGFIDFFQREISITLSPPLSSFPSPSSSSLPTPQLNSQPLVTPHYLSKSIFFSPLRGHSVNPSSSFIFAITHLGLFTHNFLPQPVSLLISAIKVCFHIYSLSFAQVAMFGFTLHPTGAFTIASG